MRSLKKSKNAMTNYIPIELLPEFSTGKFVAENKNRFLCTVEVDGTEETCYIASSCRLDNFLDLKGKDVLLHKNKGGNGATTYSVLGIKHKRSYILLNTSWANRAIENDMLKRRFSFLGKRKNFRKEKIIDAYRTDFYIPDSKSIIEVKSVISTNLEATFPTVFSERTIHQLENILRLMEAGYRGYFFVVSLNPYVQSIRLLKDTECVRLIQKGMERGMAVRGYSCRLSKDFEPHIERELPIIIDS